MDQISLSVTATVTRISSCECLGGIYIFITKHTGWEIAWILGELSDLCHINYNINSLL